MKSVGSNPFRGAFRDSARMHKRVQSLSLAILFIASTSFPVSAGGSEATPDPAGEAVTSAPRVLTLDAALAAADSDNIDIIRARLGLKAAQANLRIADTAPNPTLSLSGVQIRPAQIGVAPLDQVVDTIVSVALPLERGGKRRARVGQAQSLIAAARSDLASARRDIREAVLNAYYDLKAAEERADLLGAIAGTYAENVRLANTQKRAGALSGGDLATQTVEASRATSDAAQAQIQLQGARLALAILIGHEKTADQIRTSAEWPEGPVELDETPAERIAMQRPDVLAAQARVEAAKRNLDSAHALRHPDVTVSAQFENAASPLGVGSSVGLGISVPLPVRNRYRGDVDAASTALIAAEAEARKATAIATAEIVIARRGAKEAKQVRDHIDQVQLPAARKAARVAELAYANGAASLLDVLDARRSLREVELSAIEARIGLARALSRLAAAQTTTDRP